MHGPAFRASPTHGYVGQISPDKNVTFPCTGSADPPAVGTPPSRLDENGFVMHGPLTWPCRPCMRFLFVAPQFWRECDRRRCWCRLNERIRRLPPHGLSPPRSCPRLVLPRSESVIDCLPSDIRPRTGDFHPTSSRPCRAYRRVAAGFRLRRNRLLSLINWRRHHRIKCCFTSSAFVTAATAMLTVGRSKQLSCIAR